MSCTFVPQPYPLYAISLTGADFPVRFQVAATGIQLVIGWITDSDGSTWPALGGAVAFTGPVIYAETREQATAAATLIGTGDATKIRDTGPFAFVS